MTAKDEKPPRDRNPSVTGTRASQSSFSPTRPFTLRPPQALRDGAVAPPRSPAGGNILPHSDFRPPVARLGLPTNLPTDAPTSIPMEQGSSSPGNNDPGNTSNPGSWFVQLNQNPSPPLSQDPMDVDRPFTHAAPGPLNDGALPQDLQTVTQPPHYNPTRPPMPARIPSSGAEDYRSVIDDLTVEIKQLKEELKRYKQTGPHLLKNEKLFEIKVHGLPKRKKRELEATLRDFAASLDGSSSGRTSSSNRNRSRHSHMYSEQMSMSRHASSSTGSHLRPVDSAYASMSTGNNSSGRHSSMFSGRSGAKYTELKVQNYLKDIPEGLYPRHITMSEKQKKKLVVRRLEQLFTGKASEKQKASQFEAAPTMAIVNETPPTIEPAREARILPTTGSNKKNTSRGNNTVSASQSLGDQTSQGGSGNGSGNGNGNGGGSGNEVTNASRPTVSPPEQRPTRPRDLDPDRTQDPSENIEYLRHLGMAPPDQQRVVPPSEKSQEVVPDMEGWVYLNLLCNLAQLHIFNVTPAFIRTAVSEKSDKFQLSSDGRQIRWRGGRDGTKFSSDSSGESMRKSQSTEDPDSPSKEEKGWLNRNSSGNNNNSSSNPKSIQQQGGMLVQTASALSGTQPTTNSGNKSKFGPQVVSEAVESFHYKPLFVRRRASRRGQTSTEDSSSSPDSTEESYLESGSGWNLAHTASSSRRRRVLDGAIIYYSGAPFCTDLSRDQGDQSPTTYMHTSADQTLEEERESSPAVLHRTDSGSSLAYRPLSARRLAQLDAEVEPVAGNFGRAFSGRVRSTAGDSGYEDEEMDAEFPWSDSKQDPKLTPLEPCGLGGVLPDDHFTVSVVTRRSTDESQPAFVFTQADFDSRVSLVLSQLRTALAGSKRLPPTKRARDAETPIEVEYLSGRVKRLRAEPLPPPTIFFPPFSSDESSSESLESGADDDEPPTSDRLGYARGRMDVGRTPHAYQSLSSSEVEESGSGSGDNRMQVGFTQHPAARVSRGEQPVRMQRQAGDYARPGLPLGARPLLHRQGSSAMTVATAGGGASGYSSGRDDSG